MVTRNYASEYRNYQGTETQKKRRAMRNKARRMMTKAGRVSKGDGRDVDHLDKNPFNNTRSNLKIRTQSSNRSRNY